MNDLAKFITRANQMILQTHLTQSFLQPKLQLHLASLKHMWYVFWARGSPYGKLKNLAVKWCLNNKYWDFQLPKNTNIPRYEPSLNWLMFVSFLLPPIHIVLCFFLFFFFSVAFLFDKHLNLAWKHPNRQNKHENQLNALPAIHDKFLHMLHSLLRN